MKYNLDNTALELVYAAFIDLPVGWSRPVEDFAPGSRCRVELNVITGGCYTLESADGAVHVVREGSLFMDRLMDRQCSSNRENQPLKFIGMRFAVYNQAGTEITFRFEQPFPIIYSNPTYALFIRQTAEMAVRFFHNEQKQAAAHCAKTILHLTRFGAAEEPLGQLQNKTHIRQIAGYMFDHLAEPLQIEELARMLGYSRTHFSGLFKQVMGVCPKEYLCQLRIEQAKDLLRGTTMSIEDVARAIGHSDDLAFFYRFFKQRVGLCPGAYRTKIHS